MEEVRTGCEEHLEKENDEQEDHPEPDIAEDPSQRESRKDKRSGENGRSQSKREDVPLNQRDHH